MRILISNHALDERAGTELYVRDIALALLARGHEPIVYSRRLGAVARELRDAAVPTLDDLSKLGRPPDLIHAQHHLETMTALARFPEVPALYVCHGWLPPEEAPPRHPRIQRYVAVDELVQQRLIDECGIDPALVDVHLNFVDLDRFPRRKPLPARPRRALVFSNYLGDDNHLPVLRAACERVGLELDAIGRSSGNVAARPEEVLGRYDLVFAKARAALEAASVGAAVVLCDVAGLGPLVTADEFDRLRAFNLGARLLREPVTIERVVAQINRYDPEDAAEVTRRLRREAGLDLSVDRLIATYGAVLEKAKGRSVSLEDESQAVARYLRWGPLVGGEVHGAERELLLSQVAQERQRVATLRTALEAVRVENEELEAQAASLQREAAREHAEKVAMVGILEAERHRFKEERDRFEREHHWARHLEALETARAAGEIERAELREERAVARASLEAERLAQADVLAAKAAEVAALRSDLEEALSTVDQAQRASDARQQALKTQAAALSNELQWMAGSITWRLRALCLSVPGIRRFVSALRRLR